MSPRTVTGDDPTATAPYQDAAGDLHWNGTTVFVEAALLDFGEGAVSNIICSGTVAVTIPSYAADQVDVAAVDVAAAFTASIAVGDFVIAASLEALPTDCVYLGCRVSATDEITLSFGSLEAGAGVTGAAKNFKFLVIKAAASA